MNIDQLEAAVRTAVAHVPPMPQDLDRVRARARAFRRRRTVLRAAMAGVVVLALGAAVPGVRAMIRSNDVVVGDPHGRYPIGLWRNRDEPPVTQGLPSGLHVPGSSGEISAQMRTVNGTATIVAVGEQPGLGEGTYAGPAPLPGGQLATIGVASARQGYRVVVVDAGGHVVSSRPLPETNSHAGRSMPMTGSGTTLFWWQLSDPIDTQRPVLLTYDIAAGTVRRLTPSTAPTGFELPYFGMQATADRIVEWPAEFGRTCSAEVLDAHTGERVALLRPAISGCTDVYYALSPDNKRVAALVTHRDASSWSQRVIVVDAATGKIQKEFPTPALAAGTDRSRIVSGIDWADRKYLRYARGVLPANGRTEPAAVVLTFRP
ncbi:hypothetical protein [Paractinoplanes globisporus]|uniref:Uncharacterized protein n=1 Tax=Paractinoplanes globisporus TaxID=113565 RepID=A0ABW6WB30_9ACTN|nr:hypothetical protein [Actinoplanes globisporus]